MCMRAAAFHARHPPAIMHMVKRTEEEGEKEIAKAHGGSKRTIMTEVSGLSDSLFFSIHIHVQKTTTTICQRLRDGSRFYPRIRPLSLSRSFAMERKKKRRKERLKEERALPAAWARRKRGTFFLRGSRVQIVAVRSKTSKRSLSVTAPTTRRPDNPTYNFVAGEHRLYLKSHDE